MRSAESLKQLIELFRLVSRSLPLRAQYLSKSSITGIDTASRFYGALSASEPASEDELASRVFDGKVSRVDALYRVHRSRFKQRLLNTLFVLDLDSAGLSQPIVEHYRLEREAFMAKTLLRLGAKSIGIHMAQGLLEDALKEEHWDVALNLLPHLRMHATWRGERDEMLLYAEEYERVTQIALAFNRASFRYESVVAMYSSSASEKFEVQSMVERFALDVDADYQKYGTFGLAFARYRLFSALYQSRLQYAEAIALVEEMQEALEKKFARFRTAARSSELAMKKLASYLQMRNYAKAAEALKECEAVIPSTVDNWYAFKEHEFILLMHTEQFDEAQRLFDEIVQSARFTELPTHRSERWDIFGLYLDYVQGRGDRMANPEEVVDFLSLFKHDKSGFYAAALILQNLLLIERREFDRVISKSDAFKVFQSRYLRGEENAQIRSMFRLLRLLERADYDVDAAEEAGKTLTNELENSTILQGIQIMPYGWLWRHALETLRRVRSTSLTPSTNKSILTTSG